MPVGAALNAVVPLAAVEHGGRLRVPPSGHRISVASTARGNGNRDGLAHEPKTALTGVRLATNPCIGIGGRGVRFIRALLIVEVRVAVAPRRAPLAPNHPQNGSSSIEAHASISVPSTEKRSLDKAS